MKKVLKPSQKEESVYYSDFSGKCFGDFGPEITVKFDFNYGSKHDGASFVLHLTDDELEPILELIKLRLTEEAKTNFKQELKRYQARLDECINFRDITGSEYSGNSCLLFRNLLNEQ